MSENGNALHFWMTRNESRQQQTPSGLSTAHVQLISSTQLGVVGVLEADCVMHNGE